MISKLGYLFFLCFCLEGGFFLAVVPWSRFWSENLLFIRFPLLNTVFSSGFVRGAVTGVGIVLFSLGLYEAFTFIRGWKSRKSS